MSPMFPKLLEVETYVQKRAPLFSSHLSISIAEHKSDCRKEVAFPRAIAPDNHVVFRRERLDHGLLLVAGRRLAYSYSHSRIAQRLVPFEALNDDLFDVHLEE